MVLPLMTALSRIDPSLWDASEALGAGRWRTFLMRESAVISGSTIRGIWTCASAATRPPSA
jgi:ABC-type spermidine/putrescine transport system permease subunit I